MDPMVQIFYALIVLVVGAFSAGVGACLLVIAAKAWIGNRHK